MVLGAGDLRGQDLPAERPTQGLVWDVPSELGIALAQIQAFEEGGVEALRTGIVRQDTLLSLADSLGIAFYQDLPARYWSAAELSDSLHVLQQELEEMLLRAQRHTSARHVGLATLSDTSTPQACEPIEELANQVAEQGPGDMRTYYVTRFVEYNPCAGVVDLVLFDARDLADPYAVLRRWHDQLGANETPAGIGALGTWVDPEAGSGLHAERSRERQARYLETQLGAFLGGDGRDAGILPDVLFVYRWQDAGAHRDGYVPGEQRPRSYAMFEEGVTYPAWDVVEGWFTGRQTVFAFHAGESQDRGWPWLVIIAWFTIAVIGGFYAGAPRFRRMVRRYFSARGFYREAVREGRNVLLGPSLLLMAATGISAGVILGAFLTAVQHTLVFEALLSRLTPQEADQLAGLLAEPWTLVLFIAGGYAAAVCVWSILLALFSQRGLPLGLDQVLMLIVWPQWPAIVLMLLAVAVAAWPPEQSAIYLLAITGAWVLMSLGALIRTLYDYKHLARISWALVLISLVASPVFIVFAVGALALLEHRGDVIFLWHILTRT